MSAASGYFFSANKMNPLALAFAIAYTAMLAAAIIGVKEVTDALDERCQY
mgnify:CR=1 FL=1